jgi:hypothetical protein
MWHILSPNSLRFWDNWLFDRVLFVFIRTLIGPFRFANFLLEKFIQSVVKKIQFSHEKFLEFFFIFFGL